MELSLMKSRSTSTGPRMRLMAAKKLIYPAADRNKDPILAVLRRYISDKAEGTFLEIASGTGQHVVHFASHFTKMTFTPSDYENKLLESIAAHICGIGNIRPPLKIDVNTDCHGWANGDFEEGSLDYMYCANMIHITPYPCTIGLFTSAGILLKKNGMLFTYGPYAFNGRITPYSNVVFNASLKSQDPEWGIRDIEELELLAKKHNILRVAIVDMPVNNKTIVWQKY